MDATAIRIVREFLSSPLPDDTKALLLVEFDGTTSTVSEDADSLVRFLTKQNIRYVQAADQEEIEDLWQARRSI